MYLSIPIILSQCVPDGDVLSLLLLLLPRLVRLRLFLLALPRSYVPASCLLPPISSSRHRHRHLYLHLPRVVAIIQFDLLFLARFVFPGAASPANGFGTLLLSHLNSCQMCRPLAASQFTPVFPHLLSFALSLSLPLFCLLPKRKSLLV